MAHIYPHKLKGWQVLYEVWFPEGNSAKKTRYSRKRLKADQIYREVSTLEDLSRRGSLNRKEVVFFLNRKYISREEPKGLRPARSRLPGPGASSGRLTRTALAGTARATLTPATWSRSSP